MNANLWSQNYSSNCIKWLQQCLWHLRPQLFHAQLWELYLRQRASFSGCWGPIWRNIAKFCLILHTNFEVKNDTKVMETNQHLFLGGGCFIFSTSQAQDLSIKRDNVRILDDFRLMSRLLTFKSSMQIRAKWANHTLMDLAKGNTRKIHQSGSVNHSSRIWRNQKSSGDFSLNFLTKNTSWKSKQKKSCDYFAFNHLYQRLGFPGHLEKVLLPERPCAQCRDCPETGSTSATGVGWWLMIFCPLQCQKWHKRKCFKKKKKKFLVKETSYYDIHI